MIRFRSIKKLKIIRSLGDPREILVNISTNYDPAGRKRFRRNDVYKCYAPGVKNVRGGINISRKLYDPSVFLNLAVTKLNLIFMLSVRGGRFTQGLGTAL